MGRDGSRGMTRSNPASSGGYFLAFLGALVYYLRHAHSFGEGVLGVLKAFVWPALLVYHLLAFLHL